MQGVRITSLTRYGLIGVTWFICVSFKLLWQRYSIQLLDVAMGYPHWLAYSEGSSQKHWKSILNSIFLTLSCWLCKSKLMPSSHQSSETYVGLTRDLGWNSLWQELTAALDFAAVLDTSLNCKLVWMILIVLH